MSIDEQVEIERARNQIRALVAEIEQLARGDLAEADFFRGLLERVLMAMEAVAGLVWLVGEGGRVEPVCHAGVEHTGIAATPETQAAHGALVQSLIQSPTSLLVPPHSELGGGGAAGGTSATEFRVRGHEQARGALDERLHERPVGRLRLGGGRDPCVFHPRVADGLDAAPLPDEPHEARHGLHRHEHPLEEAAKKVGLCEITARELFDLGDEGPDLVARPLDFNLLVDTHLDLGRYRRRFRPPAAGGRKPSVRRPSGKGLSPARRQALAVGWCTIRLWTSVSSTPKACS